MPAGKPAIPVTPCAQGVLWGAGVLQGQPWQAGWCCGCLAHLRLSADLGARVSRPLCSSRRRPSLNALSFH